ncbi:LLM class flavin-dependent oxidoreductase [Actinophytocola sp.]|uniref:LLM class flavin-dependent oxidoreductase n=1 Tax=Actinophytocola sp. TaxID=1872138 RepID=UPI003D6B9ADF
MHVAAHLPGNLPGAEFRRVALAVAGLGLHSVWVGDHVVVPASIAEPSGYPYAIGEPPPADGLFPQTSFLEAVCTAAFLAALGTGPRVGLGPLFLPPRDPALLVAQLATVERLLGTPLITAVDLGWLRGEFAALGVDFEHRERRFGEAVRLLRENLATELWVTGNDEASLDRCARMGDGWHALGLPPPEFRARNERLTRRLADLGRDPAAVPRTVACRLRLSRPEHEESTMRQLRAYAAAGCDLVVVLAAVGSDVDAGLGRLRRVARLAALVRARCGEPARSQPVGSR